MHQGLEGLPLYSVVGFRIEGVSLCSILGFRRKVQDLQGLGFVGLRFCDVHIVVADPFVLSALQHSRCTEILVGKPNQTVQPVLLLATIRL